MPFRIRASILLDAGAEQSTSGGRERSRGVVRASCARNAVWIRRGDFLLPGGIIGDG